MILRLEKQQSDTVQKTETIRLELIIALMGVIIVNLPYLFRFSLIHDGLQRYLYFYYVYSEFLYHNTLPNWIPVINFGVPVNIYLWGITPAGYLIGVIGWLLHITDTVVLYGCSTILDLSFLIFGLWLLAGEIFTLPISRWIVLTFGVFCQSWQLQPFFNMNIIYLLPAVLYLLLKFFRTGTLRFFWMAVILELVSIVGAPVYIAPVHLLVLICYTIPLAIRHRYVLESFRGVDRWLTLDFLSAFIVFIIMALYLHGFMADMVTNNPDRALNGNVDIKTFETRVSFATTYFGFFTGGLTHADNTNYMGLLPIGLLFYSMATCSGTIFYAFFLPAVVLMGLSVGGYISHLIYHFPGMHFFRHIWLLYPITRILILFIGVYGVEAAITPDHDEKNIYCNRSKNLILISVLAGSVILDALITLRANEMAIMAEPDSKWPYWLAFRLAIYVILIQLFIFSRIYDRSSFKKNFNIKSWITALFVVFFMDLLSFQAEALYSAPFTAGDSQIHLMLKAHPQPFICRRTDNIPAGRSQDLLRYFDRETTYRNCMYDMMLTALWWDPTFFPWRTVAHTRYVESLLDRLGNPKDEKLRDYMKNKNKLMLVDSMRKERLSDDFTSGDGKAVQVESFSANRLCLDVTNTGSDERWLVYMDSYYPGWKAYVDGIESPVVLADGVWKSVKIPAGKHRVIFTYKALLPGLLAGMCLSAGLCILSWMLLSMVMGRRLMLLLQDKTTLNN